MECHSVVEQQRRTTVSRLSGLGRGFLTEWERDSIFHVGLHFILLASEHHLVSIHSRVDDGWTLPSTVSSRT